MAQRSLFNIPSRPDKEADSAIAKKSKTAAKSPTTKNGGSIATRTSRAKALLEEHLDDISKFKAVRDLDLLQTVVTSCIENGIVAIDTETTGLDPLQDDVVGVSLSTRGDAGEYDVYIPLGHISYIDHTPIEGQLSREDVQADMQRLADSDTFVVMFNADFDIRVIMNHIGVRFKCDWDCYLAARLMNDNEESKALKPLHHKYCSDKEGEVFKFGDLFDGIVFNLVPINVAYIYAANDSKITLDLYEFQKQYLYYDPSAPPEARNGMNGVSWVFFNIEMPCVDVVVDMENTGVKFDTEYSHTLKEKYHALLEDREREFHAQCAKFGLADDINIKSVKQLQKALYDDLGLVAIDPKTHQQTTSTSVDALSSITPKHPVVEAILSYKEFFTITSTFVDKLPNTVNPKDGRIHCSFNQYGADTGRFSSDRPNLQNIPSHVKDIRQMFVASDGYVLLSSDYSQQEPSCLASLCNQMGYPNLYESRRAGDDIYSHVASACFNVPYEMCCEFDKDGKKNPPEYKKRRSDAKPVLLGILYCRGDESVAEGMGITLEQAKQLKANLYNKYPEIKAFEDASLEMAETVGYVTTVCGRKRRLPSMLLPDYEVKWKDGAPVDDDPLAFDSDVSTEVPMDIQRKWLAKVKRAYNKRKVFEEANKEGLWIVDHTRDKDVTKVVNARIQGSAADLTKLAMVDLRNNKRLQELGFRILIPIHDEIMGECPLANAKECAKLLAEVMSHAAEKILAMPFNCDVEVSKAWYGDSIEL